MKKMKRGDMMKKSYVGLDIHEESITGIALNEKGVTEFYDDFPNTKEAIQGFLSGVPSPQITIAIEACELWRGVYYILSELEYQVVLANPAKTRQIAGVKKTDKVDATTLAELLRIGYLPWVHIPGKGILLIRDVTRHRKRLVEDLTRLKCRAKSYLRREGIKFPKTWNKETYEFFRNASLHTGQLVNVMDTINLQIKEVDKEIRVLAKNTPLSGVLRTAPGIGNFGSLMIIGEVSEVTRFPRPKNLVSYAGLCPGIYQSGSRSHPVRNKACNKYLKWIMYECSGKAITMDTKYKTHYWKLFKRKGEHTARRSTARKMLTDVWYMLTYEEPYRP